MQNDQLYQLSNIFLRVTFAFLIQQIIQSRQNHYKHNTRFTDRSRDEKPFLTPEKSIPPRFVRFVRSSPPPLEGTNYFRSDYHPIHIFPRYEQQSRTPSRRRRKGRGSWLVDDYPKLLPRCCRAFVPDATRGETRQRRPRLPADPYYGRHCASSRGHRRRQKEAARGSSFPERAPLCPRDYELASISWMEHPPGPSPCIMGDDALITATSWQRSAFETVFRISRTREEEHSS